MMNFWGELLHRMVRDNVLLVRGAPMGVNDEGLGANCCCGAGTAWGSRCRPGQERAPATHATRMLYPSQHASLESAACDGQGQALGNEAGGGAQDSAACTKSSHGEQRAWIQWIAGWSQGPAFLLIEEVSPCCLKTPIKASSSLPAGAPHPGAGWT